MPWMTPFVSVEMIFGTSFLTFDLALEAPDSSTPTLFSQPSALVAAASACFPISED